MKILTDATALDLEFLATAEIESFEPKADRESGAVKTSFDGRPLYGARGLELLRRDEQTGRVNGTESGAYLSLITPPVGGVEFGRRYRATGAVQITHFVMNGRLAVSLQVEGLEPVA